MPNINRSATPTASVLWLIDPMLLSRDVIGESKKAEVGFEPTNNGFAIRPSRFTTYQTASTYAIDRFSLVT
jgi:hypothetical protein